MDILRTLAAEPRNQTVIISGRDRRVLEKWLGGLDVTLVAEHGAWIRRINRDWQLQMSLHNDWKESLRPALQVFTDRTPGSSLEEKHFSLVWHFRNADPDQARLRCQELREAVADLAACANVGVFEGNKIVEIKNVQINKGVQAERLLQERDWRFVLAVGDDYTDEDMFAVLPPEAYSIRVGRKLSKAKFKVKSVNQLREFLKRLAGGSNVETGRLSKDSARRTDSGDIRQGSPPVR